MSNINDGVRASLFVTDYNVRDMFGCRQAPELELSDMLATARAESRAAGLEEAAEWHDTQARCCECADDTMQGVRNGDKHRVFAAAIRALKEKP